MQLYLNDSLGRSKFKDLLGNANHLIITTLVGLHAVEVGLVVEAPKEMRAAWSPKDRVVSARRARRLVLDVALVRAIDALDVYIKYARRAPPLIQQPGLRNKIDGAGRSIFGKVEALQEVFGDRDPLLFAMSLTMIAWRNRTAHSEADISISEENRRIIASNAIRLRDEFNGLEAQELLNGFDDASPRFKEVASMISATQELVKLLEMSLFRALDPEQYLKDLVWYQARGLAGPEADVVRKRHIQSIWGKDVSERPTSVLRRLRQDGLTPDRKQGRDNRVRVPVEFDGLLIEKLCRMAPTQVYEWACSGTRDD